MKSETYLGALLCMHIFEKSEALSKTLQSSSITLAGAEEAAFLTLQCYTSSKMDNTFNNK